MGSNTEAQKDQHLEDVPPPTYELALKMMSKESSPEILPNTAANLGYNLCWDEMETPGRPVADVDDMKFQPFTLTEVSEISTPSNQNETFQH